MSVIRHQTQPSHTSCGPTVVAMLTGQPVARVLPQVRAVRLSIARRRRRDHKINVGELRRLLARHRLLLGHRWWPDRLALISGRHVLRVPNGTKSGWHWCVIDGDIVYDPALDEPRPQAAWLNWAGMSVGNRQPTISAYSVRLDQP